LTLPLLVIWFDQYNQRAAFKAQPDWKWYLYGASSLLPVVGYVIWRLSPLGVGWQHLQDVLFGRGLMTIDNSIRAWGIALNYGFTKGGGAGLIYLWIDLLAIALTLIASIWLLRRDLPLGLFSLAIVLLSVFSGATNSMARYMIIAPALYIFLAHLGKNKTFDRVWTVASTLLLGMEAALFAFEFWVG
jgi:hypothetical protein